MLLKILKMYVIVDKAGWPSVLQFIQKLIGVN